VRSSYLRCPPNVAMMQAPDFGNRNDRAERRRRDAPSVRRILLQREMRSCAVIGREVRGPEATPVAFAQHEDMLQALAADRANEPFHERTLPGALGGREALPNRYAIHALPEGGPSIVSRSRRREDGAVSFGKASTIGGPPRPRWDAP